MYALKNMTTPAHTHKKKKEDIICRWGQLDMLLWKDHSLTKGETLFLKINGQSRGIQSGIPLHLQAGERVTLEPGIYHEFFPASQECIIGEVSTANDDLHDNFFINPDIGRFPGVDEDEPPLLKLVSDKV
jgi:D-lyxose ketol-isomerase